MRRCFLSVLSALVLATATAHAAVDEDDDHAPRAWEDRSGWSTEIAVGNGVGVVGRGDATGIIADTTVRVGFHRVGAFHGKSLLGLHASELSWCMPLAMCGGPIGLFIGPTSGFVGNEIGFDVAAHLLHGVSGEATSFGYAVGVRPALRIARDSRFRTASFVGALLPELGLAFPNGRSHEVYFEFSLYPVAATLTREIAVQWEVLRERFGIPLDGTRASITVGTGLSVMLL